MNLFLVPPLLAVLAVVALGLHHTARLLGVRLGGVTPWVWASIVIFLSPWLLGERLLAPTNLLLGGMLPGIDDPVAAPHELLNDAFLQFLPWELEIRRQWSAGEPAFWSPSLEGGSSLWQNPQSGVLSPFSLVARAFPLRAHLLVALALKMVVGALGVAALARRLGSSEVAAGVAGLAFAFSGPMLAWALFPHTSVVACIPWLGLASVAVARGGGAVQVAVCALTFTAVLVSGHPEVALAGGLVAALLALGLRRRRERIVATFGRLAASALLGAALAGPVLLPFLLALPDSQRFAEMTPSAGEWLQAHAASGRGDVVRSLASPYAYGRPFTDTYEGGANWAESLSGAPGALVVFAAALALLLPGRALATVRRGAWPALLLAAGFWGAAAGWGPWVQFLRALPVVDVMEYRRALLPAGVVLAALAGPGLTRLLRGRSWRAAIVGVLVLAAGLASARWGAADASHVACALLVAAALVGARRRATVLLVVALVLAQWPWAWRMLPRAEARSFFPTPPAAERIASELAASGPWRAVGGAYEVYPSLFSVWGIEDARTHNPMAPRSYSDLLGEAFGYRPETASGNYFSELGNLSHPLLDYLGVRAVVLPAQLDVPADLEEIGSYSHRRVLFNAEALPRWFVPRRIEVREGPVPPTEVAALDTPRHVLVEGCEVAGEPVDVADPRVVSLAPARVRLRLTGTEGPLLASSVLWSPGWRASSAQGELTTCRINAAFLGVGLAEGVTEVTLSFLPPGLRLGLLSSALASVGLALVLMRRRWPAHAVLSRPSRS